MKGIGHFPCARTPRGSSKSDAMLDRLVDYARDLRPAALSDRRTQREKCRPARRRVDGELKGGRRAPAVARRSGRAQAEVPVTHRSDVRPRRMSNVNTAARGASFNTFLLIPSLLFFGLLTVAVLRSPNLMSTPASAARRLSPRRVLSTYALMATALAGPDGRSLDRAADRLHQRDADPARRCGNRDFADWRLCLCLAAGVAYQVVFALIVIWVRVQPIIVPLSGFLALSGINLVILPRPGGTAPEWMAGWGAGRRSSRRRCSWWRQRQSAG